MNYRKINNITGWATWAISLYTFLVTMEPTVSFWDCGEFLSCAYKLEVGHSPGAPFFMLLQRLFSLFGGVGAFTGQASPNYAILINSLSAVTSALTTLFLFWTVTHFAKKLIVKDDTKEPTANQTLLIMGAGVVGALANGFSDTFWFSAVEAEVYGTSSFFTAITFWAILKWEAVAHKKYADRWIVLIAYLIGISVCVHLLNLLTIPALAMVYYFKRYKTTVFGTCMAFVIGCVVLAFVQFGVIQYIPKLASGFDIWFTNGMGMSFDTGAIVFLVLLAAFLVGALMLAKSPNIIKSQPVRYSLHTSVLCIIFIIIGYSAYFSAIIRSRADVPIDMTNPDNPISFLDYVDREQFGQQPLFFGPYYNSVWTDLDTSGKLYAQSKNAAGKDVYEVVGKKIVPKYGVDANGVNQSHFFPRIYDNNEGAHLNFYMAYLGLTRADEPTWKDNLKYFFGYQMDWMWWRYFMWNFAGRQNDVEGQGDPQKGNWISGIAPLDNMRGLGDTDKMGDINNASHNKLYFLPLIVGILGLIYQFNRNKNDGIVVAVLFFFTGAAIGIYLNMPPLQPRERDYAFAGCVYTFAIWIGLGVLMVADLLNKYIKGSKENINAIVSVTACALAAPVLMANVEWKDHDRGKKRLAFAVAYNTLSCCDSNAVLFTYGDNQTYPLWYIQEIEHFRPDVRVINTSLLGIDWYIDQLNYKVNDADAVPMMWKRENYLGDRHNYIQYFDNKQIPQNSYYRLSEICDFMNSSEQSKKVELRSGDWVNFMPVKNFFTPSLTKAELVQQHLVSAADTNKIITEVKFTYPKTTAYKSDLAVLNIVAAVANQGWKRPLYFDAGLRSGDYAGMGDFLRMEGVVYHLVPYKFNDSMPRVNSSVLGTINTEKSFDLFVKRFVWGGGERKDVYFDEPNRHEFVTYRMDGSFIANQLIVEGKKDKAIELLDKVMAGITEESYYYDYTAYFIANSYYAAGAVDKASKLTKKIVKNCSDDINWIATLRDDGKNSLADDVRQQFQLMQSLGQAALKAGDSATANSIQQQFTVLFPKVKEQLMEKTPRGPQQPAASEE
jgi:tetratricopeptide (TPR) repeat protein